MLSDENEAKKFAKYALAEFIPSAQQLEWQSDPLICVLSYLVRRINLSARCLHVAPVDSLAYLDASGKLHQLPGHPSVFVQSILELLRNFRVHLPCFVSLRRESKRIRTELEAKVKFRRKTFFTTELPKSGFNVCEEDVNFDACVGIDYEKLDRLEYIHVDLAGSLMEFCSQLCKAQSFIRWRSRCVARLGLV